MRSTITLFALLATLVLWGCSPKKPGNSESSNARTLPAFHIEESPDTLEQKQIKAQAIALFTNGAFGELDALAAKYRTSKEAYADGTWKLTHVYQGLEQDVGSLSGWTNRVAKADEWIRKNRDSITARVAKARILISYGWAIRGGGYSDTVKEKQWTQFNALLLQAAQVLKDAKQLRNRCPLYWSTWQRAAMGLQLPKKDYDALFQEAIKEFPDYWYYYSTRATFLLPRWYGAQGEWQKDLTQSADRIGGEAGDMLYAQVVCEVRKYGGGIDVFEGKRISWERIEKGLDGLLKKYPQSIPLKNERAFLAGLAGEKAKALEYFKQIQNQCDLAVWHDQQKVTNFVKWLYGT